MLQKECLLQIKPIGSSCNMNCSYCYAEPFKKQEFQKMSIELLEKVVCNYSKLDIKNPTFSWHGGEPLLYGLDCYLKAIDLQKQYFNDRKIVNMIQTNGTLVTEEIALFLKENNFIVSVSLDGPAKVHDIHRLLGNRGSFEKVMDGVKKLRNVGINPSIISTVTRENLGQAKDVFRFLVDQGFVSIKYSPVYDSNSDNFSISSDEWFNYLSEVFDMWMKFADKRIRVRELEEVIVWLKKNRLNVCSSNAGCSKWMSIDPDGNIYPCEYLRKKYLYGNIADIKFSEIITSKKYIEFGELVLTPNIQCQGCEFYDFCGNGCPSTRVDNRGNIFFGGIYVYCSQRKNLYIKIKTEFEKILGHGI